MPAVRSWIFDSLVSAPNPPAQLKLQSTATARKREGQGECQAEQFATVTMGIVPATEQTRTWGTLCEGDACDIAGLDGNAPPEDFPVCESAVYQAAFMALRRSEEFHSFFVLEMKGRIGKGGAEGFAVATLHAVWNALDYAPTEEDLTEINEWKYDGIRAVGNKNDNKQ